MTVYPIVFAQGSFMHKDKLNYPFEERGLQFGDGVYEVIRIYQGKYYLLNEHIDRLYRSLSEIKLSFPYDRKDFIHTLEELLKKNEMKTDGKVYLQVTRGSAPRDHVFPDNITPNVYAYLEPAKRNVELMKHGVPVITMPDIRWSHCHIKSLNLLPNLMAKQEAKEQGCFEAILHKDGTVTECSASNVYFVKNGKIYTHPATNAILHGCVRLAVERFADELGIPFIEEAYLVGDIKDADEVFLSSSTNEITPIINVDGHTIHDGSSGPITKQIQHAYAVDAGIEPVSRPMQEQ
ncbi:D-amino-acid transaminase [Oceanobacillus indicireducens]|uniref:D-alanine aminotransferase n=1 Tax=Oceanobacillus indicireducens TaxID=1004261 RepID=A0A917Y511_9BACI|nr:D-amino-acid transaminase [Oceanobacillus indicireducens]GGN65495.1 D-alanine aminotransferase [Oceanobacillus indicireducens]